MRRGKLVWYLCVCVLCSCVWAGAQTRPELVIQTGHAEGLKGLAFSPDGKLLASIGLDNAARLWEVGTQQELRSLADNKAEPDFVSFGLGGQTVIVGNRNINQSFSVTTGAVQSKFAENSNILAAQGEIAAVKNSNGGQLFNVTTGAALMSLEDSLIVDKARFSTDGKLLIGTSFDGNLRVWDSSTGKLMRQLKGGPQPSVSGLAVSANGRWAAAGGYDGKVMVWEISKGSIIRNLEIPKIYNVPDGVFALAFTPDERGLIRAGLAEVAYYEIATGQKKIVYADRTPGALPVATGAQFLAVSPDGATLATAGSSNQSKVIDLWDIGTGARKGRLAGRVDATYAVGFSGDGKSLFTAGQGEIVKLWSVTGGDLRPFKGLSLFASAGLAFSPDGKFLAAGAGYADKSIILREVETGREALKLAGHSTQWLRSLAYSPDGATLASVSLDQNDKAIKLWDTRTGQVRQSLPGHNKGVFTVAFALGGQVLVSGGTDEGQSSDATLKIWDTRTGQLVRTITGAGGAEPLSVSADGKKIAAIGQNYVVTLYDVATGAMLHVLPDTVGTRALAWSPDGSTLAVGKLNNEIDLYNTSKGSRERVLQGHQNWITALSFHPKGKLLLSGSRDGQAKLWDFQQGRELAALLALNDGDWLVITPDGLFDGSPGAWQQVVWRYDSNTFSIVPVEYFFNEFFSPGLLSDLLEGKRPRAPADLARKDRRQPVLQITQTAPAASGNGRTVKVRVAVTEAARDATRTQGGGAADVRLFRNGALVKAWRGDVLQGRASTVLEADVPLIAGSNELTAYGFNRDNVKSQTARLTLTGADTLKRAGVMRVLAIGVNQYANAAFNLKYAVADAQEFAAETERQQRKIGRYANIEITSLLDTEATKTNILNAISKLAAQTQPEDAVLVYFAGHGTAQQQRFYLIPHDLGYTGRRDQITEESVRLITSRSVSDRELERAFEGIDASQFLLVIDACNSGQALEAAERRRGPMNSQGLAQLAYEKGMYVLTAAQSFQAAQEASKLGHGYLTYALVEEGLSGMADTTPKDGETLAQEWLRFAARRVPEMQLARDNEMGKRPVSTSLTREIGLGLSGPAKPKKLPRVEDVQRPRLFYRQELEKSRLVVARS